MNSKSPFRCFDRRFLIEALVVAAVIIVLALIGKQFERGSPGRVVTALLEVVAFAVLIARTLLAIRSLDELQQRIHLVAIAVSFGLTAVVVTGAEFLTRAGLPMPPAGLWIWGLMGTVWGIGVVVLARRYR